MPLVPVHSIDDPRLAPYREMNERNLTKLSGLFVAEGDKVVERLLASDFEIASILAEPVYAERYGPRVSAATPIYLAPRALLEATVGFNFHRGVVACCRRRPGPNIRELLTGMERALRSTIVVCPDVQDPANLGSILRSAAAFGCQAILLGRRSADPFSRRVLRVSMGSALGLPIVESRDLAADLTALSAGGFELVATVLDPAAEPLWQSRRESKLAVLFGSEGHGLGEEWLRLCRRRVTIPLRLGVDSLNVAVAAAVVLYHFASGSGRPTGDFAEDR
jgi:tRNA G18 (ribose-2'-O)-methylase SpoU